MFSTNLSGIARQRIFGSSYKWLAPSEPEKRKASLARNTAIDPACHISDFIAGNYNIFAFRHVDTDADIFDDVAEQPDAVGRQWEPLNR